MPDYDCPRSRLRADPGKTLADVARRGAWFLLPRSIGAPGVSGAVMDSVSDNLVIQFLKRRYASAIRCGDNKTATRLRAELDRLLNGCAANSGQPMAPELPPAA